MTYTNQVADSFNNIGMRTKVSTAKRIRRYCYNNGITITKFLEDAVIDHLARIGEVEEVEEVKEIVEVEIQEIAIPEVEELQEQEPSYSIAVTPDLVKSVEVITEYLFENKHDLPDSVFFAAMNLYTWRDGELVPVYTSSK